MGGLSAGIGTSTTQGDAVVDLGQRVFEAAVLLLIGIIPQPISLQLFDLLLREAESGNGLPEVVLEDFTDTCQPAADRRLGYSQAVSHLLAGAAFQNPSAEDLKILEGYLALHLPQGRLHLGVEDLLLINGAGGQTLAGLALGGFEGLSPTSLTPLLGGSTVQLIAQRVAGNGQEPGGETSTPVGIVPIDSARQGGHGLLGQVLDRFASDAAAAPAGQLGTQNRAESLPELKPGVVVAGPEPGDELSRDVAQGCSPGCLWPGRVSTPEASTHSRPLGDIRNGAVL